MNAPVFVSSFLAATIEVIEVIEMVAIVVAVGVSRSWRAALAGAGGGLVVLAALGTALHAVPLQPIRLVVGALLLTFGSQWLRKGILRVARDGWAVGVGEEDVQQDARPDFDWTDSSSRSKVCRSRGSRSPSSWWRSGPPPVRSARRRSGPRPPLSSSGPSGRRPTGGVARIPRRALQLFVGAMLTTFGTFWAGQGLSVHWPGNELAVARLGIAYVAVALALVPMVSAWR